MRTLFLGGVYYYRVQTENWHLLQSLLFWLLVVPVPDLNSIGGCCMVFSFVNMEHVNIPPKVKLVYCEMTDEV